MWGWFSRTRNRDQLTVASSSRANAFAINSTTLSDIEDGNESDVGLLMAFDSDTAEPAADGVLLLQDEEVAGTEANQQQSNNQSCQPSACNIPQPGVNSEAVVVDHNIISGSVIRSEHSRRRRRGHHHRSRSSRRRDRANRFGSKDSNFLSAACNLIVVVLTGIAMLEPRWFHYLARCTDGQHSVDYLGIKSFFKPSSMQQGHYTSGESEVLLGCVTSNVIVVMRIIIGLCFMVLTSSLTACILDIVGSSRLILKLIQTTASLSILSVCLCITISGLCYLVTEQLTEYYISNRVHEGSRVVVEFDIGFYMITAAGALSVIAVGCALLRVPSPTSSSSASSSSSSRQHNVLWEPVSHRSGDEHLIEAVTSRTRPTVDSCPPSSRAPPPYRP